MFSEDTILPMARGATKFKEIPEPLDKIVEFLGDLDAQQEKLFHTALVAIPILGYCLFWLLGFSQTVRFLSVVLLVALEALIYSFKVLAWIMNQDGGTAEMRNIADIIVEGSEGYFLAQYGTIFKLSLVFATCLFLGYAFKDNSFIIKEMNEGIGSFGLALFTATTFMLGAFCSALSGYAGMWVSVRANVRVTAAATKCYDTAIQIAFKGGYFAAAINVALALVGISCMMLYLYFYMAFFVGSHNVNVSKMPLLAIGYGFGASFVAMFAQLGGGIYTKAADVGADLIGKVEAGIPEDDPRNPAVIADLVGDNVGDCAGQAADLFESRLIFNSGISAEMLSAMILGAELAEKGHLHEYKICFMMFPLALHCLDIVASTAGMMFVKTKKGLPHFNANYGEMEDSLDIMKRGFKFAILIGVLGFVLLCSVLLNEKGSWINFTGCGLVGIGVSYVFILSTQYYTDYKYGPVQHIAESSRTGHATNIIAGLSVGLESTGIPILCITFGLITSFYLGESSGIKDVHGKPIGGLFGTAIATMGMFSNGVYVLSMSGFGPIADNAGGIAEMSNQPESVREVTDKLDAVGNVTKANAKGYSVGSASLACFLLFSAFIDEVNFVSPTKFSSVDITIPEVFLSGLLGSMVVFIFSSWAIRAVGNAAQEVISEVRRQFKENPGILDNTSKPNYKHCVKIVAEAGIREMVKPGLLAVLSPIVVGIVFTKLGPLRGVELLGAKCVSAFLMFSTSTGILMALFFNNGGGAWDNAKKYIETGAHGGKGSEAHKAAVTGDTVGDPCKDTAGPSIHILIKLLSTITLVLTPLFIG
jgi:H(+)-translocating pyrophosphatase